MGLSQKENREQRTPAAFLPYQQAWAADESPVKVCEKSRRVGLSWAEAGDDALLAAAQQGMDVWYIGYNKDMALEFIEDAGEWSHYYNLAVSEIEDFVFKADNEDKGIQSFRIRFASGFKVTALSSRPSNLRGKQGKIVIDEAAFHEDLRGLLKAAMAMLMWGGRVVIISTHNGDDHPFNELINDIRATKKPYSLHRITLDDALRQGLYQRICLRLGKEWSKDKEIVWREELVNFYGDASEEELFCVPSQGGGAYLTRNMIEGCMSDDIPILRWEPPGKGFVDWPDIKRKAEVEQWCKENLAPLLDKMQGQNLPTWFGEDFGREVDLTVIWPIQRDSGLAYKTPFILELKNCPFKQQEQILFYFISGLPRFDGGALDKGGNGAYLAERARQKFGADRIDEVSFSQNWNLENMPPMKACFEDKTISIPKDSDILDDYRAIKRIKGVPKIPRDERTVSKRGGKRHGDAAIAGCLAIFAARNMEAGVIEYESTGHRRNYTRMSAFMGQ